MHSGVIVRPKKNVFRHFIRQPVDAVYRWHLQKNALLRGFPSPGFWRYVEEEEIEGGQRRITYRRKSLFGSALVRFRLFFDSHKKTFKLDAENGIFKKFSVSVEIRPHSNDSCEIIQRVEFQLRHAWFFPERRIKKHERYFRFHFDHRFETISKDLEFSNSYDVPKGQRILISGAKGLVGRNLRIFLESMGHQVYSLTRKRTNGQWDVYFNDKTGEVDLEKLEGFDAVIHLRGKNVATRWSQKVKNELVRSRVESTKKLSHHLALLNSPPKVFLCASAVGIYGDRGEEVLDEKSEPGQGSFLSELVREWEDSCKVLIRKNIRVVNLRFAMILSMAGGALPKMVWPIRLGLAGALGDGRQYYSPIAIDDAISAIVHCMFKEEIAGPVNICGPNPTTNYEFSQKIADFYNKPLGPRVPVIMIRLLTAEMGDEIMLASTRCIPKVLLNSGFRFRYSTVKEALERTLVPSN